MLVPVPTAPSNQRSPRDQNGTPQNDAGSRAQAPFGKVFSNVDTSGGNLCMQSGGFWRIHIILT